MRGVRSHRPNTHALSGILDGGAFAENRVVHRGVRMEDGKPVRGELMRSRSWGLASLLFSTELRGTPRLLLTVTGVHVR